MVMYIILALYYLVQFSSVIVVHIKRRWLSNKNILDEEHKIERDPSPLGSNISKERDILGSMKSPEFSNKKNVQVVLVKWRFKKGFQNTLSSPYRVDSPLRLFYAVLFL